MASLTFMFSSGDSRKLSMSSLAEVQRYETKEFSQSFLPTRRFLGVSLLHSHSSLTMPSPLSKVHKSLAYVVDKLYQNPSSPTPTVSLYCLRSTGRIRNGK